jgi:hypothetical protein
MVLDCDDSKMTVKVYTAPSKTSSAETEVPVSSFLFKFEETDIKHDEIEIALGNTASIEAGIELRVKLYPFKNPPSMKELNTFGGYTMD